MAEHGGFQLGSNSVPDKSLITTVTPVATSKLGDSVRCDVKLEATTGPHPKEMHEVDQLDSTSRGEQTLPLYTEEEIQSVTTTSSLKKNSSTRFKGDVNFSEVSSTSEEAEQSITSTRSIFMDLYEEDIVDSASVNNVFDAKKAPSASAKGKSSTSNATNDFKPALLLLGEYADSGNDTEEEAVSIRRGIHKKLEDAVKVSTGDEQLTKSDEDCSADQLENVSNQNSNKPETLEGHEEPVASDKEKSADDKNAVTPAQEDVIEAVKGKEEGQISGSDSSGSLSLSEGKKQSKKRKEPKKDRNHKKKVKEKKKRKKKRKKQKNSEGSNDLESEGDGEVKLRKQNRSRSPVPEPKPEPEPEPVKNRHQKRSKSRSRDRLPARSRRSRSRSQDKRRKQGYSNERKRSRSRSSSRRYSTSKRDKNSKSLSPKIRSPKKSASPAYRKKERHSLSSKSTPSWKDQSTSKKRKSSRSRTPQRRHSSVGKRRKSSPRRQTPPRRSRSPGRRRPRIDRKHRSGSSPKSPIRSSRSPIKRRRERKRSPSPERKLSRRTSGGSDSKDSGHFRKISLSKTNESGDEWSDSKLSDRKSPLTEKRETGPTKSPGNLKDAVKQRSPSSSPSKLSDDDFDFVFTEHLSPKPGSEKSVEHVLFGKDLSILDTKTTANKRPAPSTNIGSGTREVKPPMVANQTLATDGDQGSDTPVANESEKEGGKWKCIEPENQVQEMESQKGSLDLEKAAPATELTVEQGVLSGTPDNADTNLNSSEKISATEKLETQTGEDRSQDKTHSVAQNNEKPTCTASQSKGESEELAFSRSKVENIPFLDETPSVPPSKIGFGPKMSLLGPPPMGMGLLPTPLQGPSALLNQGLLGHAPPGLGAAGHLSSLGSNFAPSIAPQGSRLGLLPTPENVPQSKELNSAKTKATKGLNNSDGNRGKGRRDGSILPDPVREEAKRIILDSSPVDMEMSSPEGDIIDKLNEEFWKQQHQDSGSGMKTETRQMFEDRAGSDDMVEEPYEPETGLLGDDLEEDLSNIADPKERRKRQREQQHEKTKVQTLLDRLHRQARVEEEVKHVLKAYYKHKDIDKEEYKSILRRAVPQVTDSSSAIDPERIRSLVKKYVAKIKGQRGLMD